MVLNADSRASELDDVDWEPLPPAESTPAPPPGLIPARATPPPMTSPGGRPFPGELAAEQLYFDHVDRHRERMKSQAEAPAAGANRGAAARLKAWAQRRKEHMGNADQPVAIGRIDDDESQTLYVGRETIFDEAADVLVVNWRAPAAAPFYEATPADPRGVVRKRTFECVGNTVRDFSDVLFEQLYSSLADLSDAPLVDAQLLAELDRARTGSMRDIVTTIHAAQFEVIRAPLDQMLVIEGGPGTGKTAVALHRVSWLLFNHRDRLNGEDVLVVGPHPAFTRYIRTVLPELGDTEVDQRDISQLAPQVQKGRSEPSEVRRLKGEARMAVLLARALDARIGAPEPVERLLIDGRLVTLTAGEISDTVTLCREAAGPYGQRRQLLRARLLGLVRDRGAGTDRDRFAPVDALVERLWPHLTATSFLRDLLGSHSRLLAAAGDDFTAGEVAALHRRSADRLRQGRPDAASRDRPGQGANEVWTAADLALLDEAEELISGGHRRYAHIVVDEVQDLSPMQLRSIGRRSTSGSLTVVGDLAQSTGVWARDRWTELTQHLPARQPHAVATLRYGYRVPRQIYDYAARLLPIAAPGVTPGRVVREGPAEPGVHQVTLEERAARAVTIAMAHAAEDRFVGLICPPACRADVEEALAANNAVWSRADQGELTTAINLISPQEAKGLEFDAAVVVEPEEIVAGDERGHRMLFVALTRTTRYLDIVSIGSPLPLHGAHAARPSSGAAGGPVADAAVERLAADLAHRIAEGSPAFRWDEVLERVAVLLDEQAERNKAATPAGGGRHHRRE